MNHEYWQKYRYEIVITNDQSPSLRSLATPNLESMHHSGGAYSETQLIYGEPLRAGLKEGMSAVLSLGLGLGYNEILTACEFIYNNIDGKLLTFESEKILIDLFLSSILGQENEATVLYDTIFEFFVKHYKIPILDIKNYLKNMHQSGQWIIQGALTQTSEKPFSCDIILFDAFSSKSNPELWSEDFLVQFLSQFAKEKCIFSTYACTGNLKRALAKSGFSLKDRVGFQGKRSSTLAQR